MGSVFILRRGENVGNRMAVIQSLYWLSCWAIASVMCSFKLAGLPQLQQQTVVAHTKQSSQDDLDRISRVTSGAPIEIATGLLGRRTLESLQQIERNRQRHLAQQGNVTSVRHQYCS